MTKELTFPRIAYRGAKDDTAETKRIDDSAAWDAAEKDGWRAQRGGPNAPAVDTRNLIDIPAQKIATTKEAAQAKDDVLGKSAKDAKATKDVRDAKDDR